MNKYVHTCSWRDKLIVLWILNRQAKIFLRFVSCVLLTLSFALRASSIQHFNINVMAKAKSCHKFYFNMLHKSWRKGKAPPAVTYQEYTQDESLSVVRTLDGYIAGTERWRSGEEHSQFLLSFIHPYKPVVSSTISGWLKD